MKVIIASSALFISLSLIGCNTMNQAGSTVGTGVRQGTHVVGTGVGFLANTGAAIGHGVGTVAGAGVGAVTGQPAYHHRVHHHRVHHHKHYYRY